MAKKTSSNKFLHFIKLTGEFVESLTPIIRVILIVCGCLIVTLYVRDMNNKDDISKYLAANKQYQKEKEQVLQLAERNEKEIAVLQSKINKNTVVKQQTKILLENTVATASDYKNKSKYLAAKLNDSTGTLKDSVAVLLSIIPAKNKIIQAQDSTIVLQQHIIKTDSVSLITQDSIIMKLNIVNDSLKITLHNQPKAPKNPNKIFGLPIPSRKTTFIIGVTAGLILSGAIRK